MCLDVCGLAANLYRRNTPVIKVTTPLHCPSSAALHPYAAMVHTCLPQAAMSEQCQC